MGRNPKSRERRKEWARNGNGVRGISGLYGTERPRFGYGAEGGQHTSPCSRRDSSGRVCR